MQKKPTSLNSGVSILALVVIGGAMTAVPAYADESDSRGVDRIVVTAQKRSAVAQDVPISLFAVTGDQLENAGAQSIQDLESLVSGLEIVNDSPGRNRIAIRGISDVGGAAQATQTVGYYIDETTITTPPSQMAELSLFDVERVEVLRGPQGTLFGDGSMGGTIRVITQKPNSTKFSGKFAGEVSNTKHGETNYLGRAVLNVPLVEDRLAVRMIGSYNHDGGYFDNPNLGLENTNKVNAINARIAARWTPNDDMTLDLAYWVQDIDIKDNTRSTSAFTKSRRALEYKMDESHNGSMTLNYDLGGVTFVSVSSYSERDSIEVGDTTEALQMFIGPFITQGNVDIVLHQETFTQEARLVSNGDGPFVWTLGGFYKDDLRNFQQNVRPTPDIGFLPFSSDVSFDISSWAVFGEATYELTEKLDITVGGRYSSDDRTSVLDTADFIFGTFAMGELGAGSDSAFVPKVTVNYQLSDGNLLFATVSEGFRSGGINEFNTIIQGRFPGLSTASYGAEKLWSYEGGAKLTLADNRVIWNSYIFYQDWTDIQLDFVTPDTAFFWQQNAGSARSYGFESELITRLAPGLQIGASFAYTNSQLNETVIDGLGNVLAQAGNRLPLVPLVSFGATTQYEFPLVGDFEGMVRADYSHRSETFSDPQNTPDFQNGSADVVNMRAGVSNDTWGLYVFVDNLFDELHTNSRENVQFFTDIQSYYSRPRTIGVELRAEF